MNYEPLSVCEAQSWTMKNKTHDSFPLNMSKTKNIGDGHCRED